MILSADDFAVPGVYLDSAARHPLPIAAAERIARYGDFLRSQPRSQKLSGKHEEIRMLFARLVNADPDEIALLPSTTFAETLLVQALGLPREGGGIVTDALHFAGSLAGYRSLMAGGAAVGIVPQTDGGIDCDRLADAITPGTALVALSSVSHWNGFRHDLAEVCRIAHARGALVYADVIQHAGAMPLDVAESGVDFAACATYKWLLGDMGLAFLYVRRDRIDRLRHALRRPRQPEATLRAADLFEVGTLGASAVEALLHTLPALVDGGVKRLAARSSTLTAAIDRRFPDLALTPLTPTGTATPIRAFSGNGLSTDLAGRLARQGVRVAMRQDYLRLSPSWFNTPADVDVAADHIAAALSA